MRRLDPNRPWYRYARRIMPRSGRGVTVELGSGRGEFLAALPGALPEAGRMRVGVDLFPELAASARDACGRGLVANLERPLPFSSSSIDGVVMIEVIEHIVRAEALVEEIARVLRPGGWLVLTTPNVAHFTYRLRALTGHPPKQEGYHYRFFTKKLLAQLLAEHGFVVEYRASFGKQAILTKLARWFRGAPRKSKVRYRVWPAWESLLAQHFVWRSRLAAEAGDMPTCERSELSELR